MLVEAAAATARMKGVNHLSAGGAQVVVFHSILVAAYWTLTLDEPYREFGAGWLAGRNDEAHTPLWQYAVFAVVIYSRAAVERLGVPLDEIAGGSLCGIA